MLAAPTSKIAPITGPISQAQAREQNAWNLMTLPCQIPVRPPYLVNRKCSDWVPAELRGAVLATRRSNPGIVYCRILIQPPLRGNAVVPRAELASPLCAEHSVQARFRAFRL